MQYLLSSFYFFYFSIVGVYIIFMPKVLSELGYSAVEIGIIFGAAPLVRFILPFLFVRGLELSRRLFNIALFVMLISSLSFYLSVHNFYALLVSNVFLSMGLGLTLPFVEVIALESIGKERYGKIRLFGSLGFMLVALVLVKILSSEFVALYFLLGLTSITALIAFVIAKEVHTKTQSKKEEVTNDINLFHDYKLWIGLILMQVSFGAFYNFFTIYATNNGISLDMTIYMWTFGVLVEVFMLFFQGRFLRGNLLVVLQVTIFASVIRWYLVFAYATNLEVLFFSQAIHALSFALFHTAAISYLYQLYKHKSLAQQFFSGITYGLGGLVGALSAGYIYEYFAEYLFLSSAFIALLSFVFITLWKKELKERKVSL